MFGMPLNHRHGNLRRRSCVAPATLVAAIVLGLALPASGAMAAGAVVQSGSEDLDFTFDDTMICGWQGTFVTHGQDHWIVAIADDHHGHVTYQESVVYTMTIHDGPGVPADLAGVTWRGYNVFSFTTSWDPTSSREITRQNQAFFEGPFRGLGERITLHVAPDGTVLVDRTIDRGTIDCSTLE